jgi:hypothetical protein
MGWHVGVGSVALTVLAVALLAVAVWQVIQIVRWPEGRELMRQLEEERLRRDDSVVQSVTNLQRGDS